MNKIGEMFQKEIDRRNKLKTDQEEASRFTTNIDTGSLPKNLQSLDLDPNALGWQPENAQDNDYLDLLDTWQDTMIQQAYKNPEFMQQQFIPYGSEDTNVSGMSGPESLRLSRLADAINNRYYRQPRTGSTFRGGLRGQGVVGNAADHASLTKMPIETEEMRQMQRARTYEQTLRGREIGRQQDTKDMQLEQERKKFDEHLRLAGIDSETERKKYLDQWDFAKGYHTLERDIQADKIRAGFLANLNMVGIKGVQAQMVSDFAISNPVFAAAFASLVGTESPDIEQKIWLQTAAQTVLDGQAKGQSNEKILSNLAEMFTKQGLAKTGALISSGVTGAIDTTKKAFTGGLNKDAAD